MPNLIPLVEQILVDRLLHKKAPFMRKNKFGVGLIALSGLFIVMTITFAAISGYSWLLIELSAPTAAIMTACALAVCAGVSGITGYFVLRKKPRTTSISQNEVTALISEFAELMGEDMLEPIQENPKTALLLAGLAGFVAGDRLH